MTRDTFCLGSVVKTVKSESQLASLTTMTVRFFHEVPITQCTRVRLENIRMKGKMIDKTFFFGQK